MRGQERILLPARCSCYVPKMETRRPMTTPFAAYSHLRESLISYLTAAYRISHRQVVGERLALLRQGRAVASEPLIETTPAFPTGADARALEDQGVLARGISELLGFGTPLGQRPLYAHQESALRAAFREGRHLVVASGTGSGKTEVFLAVALNQILNEARAGPRPRP